MYIYGGKVPGNKLYVQRIIFVVTILNLNVIITWVERKDRMKGEAE